MVAREKQLAVQAFLLWLGAGGIVASLALTVWVVVAPH